MKKTIKVLSIIALVLSVISLLLTFAILTFFWKPINIARNYPDEIIAIGPIIPITSMISIVGCLLVALVLLLTQKLKRFIAIEVSLFALFGVVFPFLQYYLNIAQNIWVGHSDTSMLVALGATSMALNLPLIITSLSFALCLVLMGMRIVEKIRPQNQRICVTTFSIAPTAFATLSFLLIFVNLTYFWKYHCMLYTASEEVINAGPLILTSNILSMFSFLFVSIFLLSTFRLKKFIIIEITSIVFLRVILPFLTLLFAFIQQSQISSDSFTEILRLNLTNNILASLGGITGLSSTLCLMGCGMRIAYKNNYKRTM